jgi:hypothetical protein
MIMLDALDKRQAVTAWRDRWRFLVWTTMYETGQQALKALEAELPKSDVKDVYLERTEFANPRIDKSMRLTLQPFFGIVGCKAALELYKIDPKLRDLSQEITKIDFECMMPMLAATEEPLKDKDGSILAGATGMVTAFGGFRAGLAVGLLGAGAFGAYKLAEMASPRFHGWLLDAGRKRLAQVWLGTTGDPLPVMPQIASIFDDIAIKARSITA